MKVIVLAGLVSIEKIELTRDLAGHFLPEKGVAVIDNIARVRVDKMDKTVTIKRIEGDIVRDLLGILQDISADVVIVALSEQTHPEKLFIALDDLREQADTWDIYSLAVIDTRTCDCFPNVREALERYADASVMIPYQLDEVVSYVDFT